MAESTGRTTVDEAEVSKFSAIAAQWWDPGGKFGVLHKFNPVRLAYIREHVTAHFRRDPLSRRPLDGLRILDIGCGGGLLSEPMARLGAQIVGADPSERNIKTAMVHAGEHGLSIDYRIATAEELAAQDERFDVILNMEVIEHVADPQLFISTCAGMLKPDGLMFVATINRTLKAFGLAVIGAEYVLGWLPKGTHQWEKFITPEELGDWLKASGLEIRHQAGAAYNPLRDQWHRTGNLDVNYMLLASKPAESG